MWLRQSEGGVAYVPVGLTKEGVACEPVSLWEEDLWLSASVKESRTVTFLTQTSHCTVLKQL